MSACVSTTVICSKLLSSAIFKYFFRKRLWEEAVKQFYRSDTFIFSAIVICLNMWIHDSYNMRLMMRLGSTRTEFQQNSSESTWS